jgi:hypothetical protein
MQLSPKWLFVFGLPLLFVPVASNRADQPVPSITGVKITQRNSFSNLTSERTIYIAGDRRRMEYRSMSGGRSVYDVRYGPRIAAITRCDLGQMYEVNLDGREYSSAVYPPKPLTKDQMERFGFNRKVEAPSEPTLLIETTTVDTGERKEMFGRTARHVITTRKETPLAGSRTERQETVTDGWYVDLDERISCDYKWAKNAHTYARVRLVTNQQMAERAKFVDIGTPEMGFALETKTTSRGSYRLPDGTQKETTTKSESTIVELQEGPIDGRLFEVPAGFKQVDHINADPGADWRVSLVNAWQQVKARVERLFHN